MSTAAASSSSSAKKRKPSEASSSPAKKPKAAGAGAAALLSRPQSSQTDSQPSVPSGKGKEKAKADSSSSSSLGKSSSKASGNAAASSSSSSGGAAAGKSATLICKAQQPIGPLLGQCAGAVADKVSFELAYHLVLTLPSSSLYSAPKKASFPDFEPPSQLPFTLYTAPAPYSSLLLDEEAEEEQEQDGEAAEGSSASASANARLVLAGESHAMRYLSTNGDYAHYAEQERGRARVREYDGEYLVGVFDPSTQRVTLRRAPVLTMHRGVRRLAALAPSAAGAADWASRQLARRDLGELFGNKKMKAKASNADRMKVDGASEAMQRILGQVTAGIAASTSELPAVPALLEAAAAAAAAAGNSQSSDAPQEEEGEASDAAPKAGANLTSDMLRTIPVPNLSATHPAHAYPLEHIVPAAVLRALDVRALLDAQSENDAAKALPGPGPAHKAYLREHVWSAVRKCREPGAGSDAPASAAAAAAGSSGSTPSILKTSNAKDRLRLALFAALLWALKNNARSLDDREQLSAKLRLKGSAGGSAVLDDLLSRFTEEDLGTRK